MTIARGEPWGDVVERPADVAIATSDAELAAFVAAGGERFVGVDAGDVYAYLGRPSGTGPTARRLPMDAVRLSVEGDEHLAVAHVVLRNGWWRGPIAAIMNVSKLGAWDVAPSGHPNDGRVEVVEVDAEMGVRQRLAARRRLPAGAHLPHPAITVRHGDRGELSFDRPLGVWIDGVRRATATSVSFRVEPDAYDLTC